MRKTSCKAKTLLGEFKVTIPNNPFNNNQVIANIRNFTTIPTYLKIPIYS